MSIAKDSSPQIGNYVEVFLKYIAMVDWTTKKQDFQNVPN